MTMNWQAPPPAAMSLWSGLNTAQVFETGIYFGAGIFDVEIVRALSKDTQKSGLAFIVECEVLTSTNPDHPMGSKRTWFQGMKNKNVGFGAVAGFLLSVFDLENNAARKTDFFPYLETFMSRVTGPENVLSGLLVHVECTMIKTQPKYNNSGQQIGGGTDFTRHDWAPFDYATARAMGLDMTPPRWADHLRALPAAPAYAPAGLPAANGWQRSPDGLHMLNPARNAWEPVPSAAAPPPPPPGRPMPPPPPPPPPASRVVQPWEAPGVEVSGDGKWYLIPGTMVWNPIPGR